jgi:hypothetical protein
VKASSDSDHPPKITAKLALGQFPFEIAMEQDHLFDSPKRSIEASISYNPYLGSFRLKSMLTRDLSQTTSFSIGVSHVGMSGLTWLLRYERQEVTLSVPIFVANFLSPGYWNRMISLSIFSYLIDETIGEVLESESNENVDTKNVHETIAVREHCIIEEQQWLHSSHAKSNCSQQLLIMEHIAQSKREYEESIDGLVILNATYEWLSQSFHSIAERSSIDVTTALQFWVQNSHLVLPPQSKRMLLGFYDICPHPKNGYFTKDSNLLHDMVDYVNAFLACFGVGQTNHSMNQRDEEKDSSELYGSTTLTIRYQFNGVAYEIVTNDESAVLLPSPDAFVLGSGKMLT